MSGRGGGRKMRGEGDREGMRDESRVRERGGREEHKKQ